MEKLQKALQKAREQRGVTDVDAAQVMHVDRPGTEAAARLPPAGDVETLWEALASFEPPQKAMEKHRIVTSEAGHLSTAFDILRTKILMTMRKNDWTRLAITSATMGCGKTTTACNLAIGFGRNPDQRTILVELDLRRPSVAKLLDLPKSADVTEMLSGKVSFADQARRYRQNVAVAAAHKESPDPTSILTSKTVHNTLAKIEAEYAPDLMIFDLPPLLVGDDTRSMLKEVDCALLVARADVTTVSQIDTCEREIAEHTNVLGVVLNQCRNAEDEYGYYE